MPKLITPTVRDYLHDLDRALRDLPRARRTEIVADIRAHIDAALADAPDRSPSAIATILDQLGTPTEIADAARAELPPPTRMRARDIATVVLLLVGGIVLPVLGWLIGAVLLWTSTAWRTKDKLIATLLVPGGLLTALLLLELPASTGGASSTGGCLTAVPVPVHSPGGIPAIGGNTAVIHTCPAGSSGPGLWSTILAIALLIITIAGPLFSTWWLIHHARRRPQTQRLADPA